MKKIHFKRAPIFLILLFTSTHPVLKNNNKANPKERRCYSAVMMRQIREFQRLKHQTDLSSDFHRAQKEKFDKK